MNGEGGSRNHGNGTRIPLRQHLITLRHAESGLKYILLCIFIIAGILILPFLGLTSTVITCLYILLGAVTIGLTFAVEDARDVRILILLLMVVAVFERVTFLAGSGGLRLAGLAIALVLVTVLTLYCLFDVVLSKSPVRAHIIWAAIAVYLLLGVICAIAFEIIGTLLPGSILFTAQPAQVLTTSDYIYYSFATLFTLSYGDYIPVSTFARTLALVECLLGIFFLAIIIAKLIGFAGLPGYDDPRQDTNPGTAEDPKEREEMNARLVRMEEMLNDLKSKQGKT